MWNEVITLIANVSLTLSLLVALVFGIAQVRIARRDRKERLTLETLRAFATHEFAELMNFVNSDRFPKDRIESRALSPEDTVKLLHFAQLMESLGILVAEGLVDVELVDKTLGNYVITCWDKYKLFMIPIRDRDKYLGEYFQWLADRMAERAEANPRVPFYKTASSETLYKQQLRNKH